MLSINSISKGIVIDHIRAGLGIKIYELLGLKEQACTVALIMNAQSRKLGRKDMIKIEDEVDMDLNILSLLDSNITINIIEGEKIKEKLRLMYPKQITSMVSCNNPRCITTSEKHVGQSLSLIEGDKVQYKCDYCEQVYDVKDIVKKNKDHKK